MVHLREIPRTAVFAWSPGTGKPFLVSGTRAGAVDADFSDETKLEIWDLSLDSLGHAIELQPIHSISTDSRFYDIAWGPPDADHPRGIIAGALENGSLDLWDAEKLATGASDAHIERATKHSGAIRAVQFNPLKPQILATAGANGELFIYNVEDIQNPFRLGNAAASRVDDIECLAWNKKVSHILASGSSGGLVTVWDVKTKKASLTLNNNRKAVSAIAWDPTNSTKLVTASPDDNTPVIYLWNLRNSNAPEKTLTGHEQGTTNNSADAQVAAQSSMDAEDFFATAHASPSVVNFSLPTPPNWYLKPIGAAFGFGGKVVYFTLNDTPAGQPQSSTVHIERFSADSDHIEGAKTDQEKADWEVLETLIDENPHAPDTDGDKRQAATNAESGPSKDAVGEKKKENRMSNLFGDGEDADGDDEFLAGLSREKGVKLSQPFHLLGNFTRAVDICLRENRIADAFVIANCVISEDLWDIVHNADLANWKESLATLCTFAKPAEFPNFCEGLGDRLEKVVEIWITELEEAEKAGVKDNMEDSSFAFSDPEATLASGWKLASLYDKYIEYADIMASTGLMSVAQKYLDLVPTTYEAAELARSRQSRTPATRTPLVQGGVTPTNPYSAPAPLASSTPSYISQSYAPPQQTSTYAPPLGAYGAPSANPYGAPPRNATPTSLPPPPKAKDTFSGPPPPNSPYGAGSRGGSTPPPPPKGPAPPRVSSPLVGPPSSTTNAPPRPTSSVANAYAPPPPATGSTPSLSMNRPAPRTDSPYNTPPTGAPPPSRYAPAPSAQQGSPAGLTQNGASVEPPPGSARTPSGQYAPPPAAALGQYAPPAFDTGLGTSGPPPVGPHLSAGGPPRATPSAAATATPPPPQTTGPLLRKSKYPAGDRSHIPPKAQKLVQVLESDLQRVAARAPETFKPQVNDTRKRLNLLFDHLNNAELVKDDTIQQLHDLAIALESKAYDSAQKLQVDIHREKSEECGHWMVGVKRLIAMSKATP
ncbi:protein transport protein [Sporothrix brasiliensis 5110]|uniref:Protein transport protein SEC31 n=1 Tax=Sporothrix brasiliensis 5110 TaxID=1398154 RepID=A0A0C2IWF7_9PEZI|nr:protein transport protein [Sporothrix brasiliensis 5110]KIH93486.1 protein transport protein [Sporothrix brasiliensis 5110]